MTSPSFISLHASRHLILLTTHHHHHHHHHIFIFFLKLAKFPPLRTQQRVKRPKDGRPEALATTVSSGFRTCGRLLAYWSINRPRKKNRCTLLCKSVETERKPEHHPLTVGIKSTSQHGNLVYPKTTKFSHLTRTVDLIQVLAAIIGTYTHKMHEFLLLLRRVHTFSDTMYHFCSCTKYKTHTYAEHIC